MQLDLTDILPPPFAWIDIPAGKVTLGGNKWSDGGYLGKSAVTFDVPAFTIAKYPVTNAQFGKFIKAKGYKQRQWWTDAGWDELQKSDKKEPWSWRDKKFNGSDYPVVDVNCYEAIAFCNWLNAQVGAMHASPAYKITLPTDQQWQRAAQGDDSRTYPWGDEWDCNRCNNGAKPCSSEGTTPVYQYEGADKGDSPFGVVDMAGNVWEWCSTEWYTGSNDLSDTNINERTMKGGSWADEMNNYLRIDFRYNAVPHLALYCSGFRIALVQETES